MATGKPYRYLVSGDRVKRYDVSRADLQVRPQSQSSDDDEDKISDGIVDNRKYVATLAQVL